MLSFNVERKYLRNENSLINLYMYIYTTWAEKSRDF